MVKKPTYEELEQRVQELEKASLWNKRFEEELKTVETTHRNIFLNSQIGLFRTDLNTGFILDANGAFAQFLGYKDRDELFAQPFNMAERYVDSRDCERMLSLLKEHGEFKNFEARYRRNDDSIIWMRFSGKLVFEKGWFEGASEDITKEKMVEETLRKSEEKFREITEISRDIHYRQDFNTGALDYMSPSWSHTLGYTIEETINMDFEGQKKLFYPEDLPMLLSFRNDLVDANTKGERYIEREFRMLHKSGEIHWMNGSYFLTRNDSGDPKFIVGVLRDITESKKAGEALRESERLYRLLADNVHDNIWTMDMEMKFTYFSPSIIRLRGYSVEEAMAQSFDETMTSASLDIAIKTVAEELALHNRGQRPRDRSRKLEVELCCKDGSTIWAEVEANFIYDADDQPQSIIGVTRDITERKRIEEALRESEERYRMLFNRTNDAVLVHQPCREGKSDTFIEANEVACQMYGYSKDELLGLSPLDLVVHEREEAARTRAKRMFSDGQSIFEIVHKTKDGKEIPVEVSAHRFDFQGQSTVLSIVRDITDRKRVEEQLLQSENSYRILAENPNSIVMRFDADGNIIFVNRYASELFGYSIDEMLGKKSTDLIHSKKKSDRAEAKNFFSDLLENPKKYRTNENENITKDGKVLWISWTNTPTYEDDGSFSGIISTGFDNTERKQAQKEKAKLEARLQQAQKMESIGTLAGGIAHDFNNVLFPLLGFAEMLKDDLPADSPLQVYIDEILHAALRSKDLVKQILVFSHQEDPNTRPTKLQPIVKEALKLLRPSIPTTIEIQQNIDPACGIIVADPTQVHQIIMNLATNAYHAMEETGGRLSVTLKQVRLDPDPSLQPELVPGEYARLTVADTGIGIEKDVIAKVFDPYYTTKETGKGTGLGLAVVQGIVKKFKGDIHLNSEPGEGTEIQVYLPILERTVHKEQAERSEPILGGTEKILLVDDEEAIVKMEKQMLERLGYGVTIRTGSVEALKVFRANPDAFDLIITDMAMPNMTGLELIKEIKNIRPNIPNIICTGFSDQITEGKSKALGIQGFVMKPVIMKEIAKTIRKVLDK